MTARARPYQAHSRLRANNCTGPDFPAFDKAAGCSILAEANNFGFCTAVDPHRAANRTRRISPAHLHARRFSNAFEISVSFAPQAACGVGRRTASRRGKIMGIAKVRMIDASKANNFLYPGRSARIAMRCRTGIPKFIIPCRSPDQQCTAARCTASGTRAQWTLIKRPARSRSGRRACWPLIL